MTQFRGLGLGLGIHPAALSAGVGVRTTPLRIATFGDSTGDYFALNDNTDVSAWDYEFTAGTQQVTRQQSKTLVAALYGQAFMIANGGIGGQSTSAMIARSSGGASATRKAMEDIIALAPDVVLLRAGINDLKGLETAAATFGRMKTIIDTFADAGIWVVCTGLYGYDEAADQVAIRAALVSLNAMLAAYSRSKYEYIETSGVTHDGTGAFISGMDADDLHLSNKGGLAIAKRENTVLRGLFGQPASERFPGANVIPNANLAASGSQAFGTVGTQGWAVSATNTTRANAKIETIDGVVMQTCEFTPTADNGLGQIFIPYGVFGASPTIIIAAGEVWGYEVDFYIAGLDGTAPPNGYLFSRMELFTGTPRNLYGPMESNFTPSLGEALHGKAIWEPVTIPDFGGSQANLTSSCRWQFAYTAGISGDRTPFKMGVGAPRMVRLA